MKKLVLVTAMVLATITITNAQSSVASTSTEEAPTTLTQVSQDDFSEVKISELPQAVKDAVAKDLEGAVVSKAFANKKGEFKLVVSTAGSKEAKTLYVNSNGEWIKKE